MQQIGKYKVIKKLGSGSFGFVYLAEDPKLQLQVAIKIFKIKDVNLMSQVTSVTKDPEKIIKQRFINEAQTLRKLSETPYIVEMYEFNELADGTPYYVMPYISRTLVSEIGQDAFNQGLLEEIPKSSFPKRISTIQAIEYLKQLSKALCAVHKHGLVHRDIKPENILINTENQLQLSDFGIAKLPSSDHTQTGFSMGSKNYLSPEQQESAKHVDATSDIYSLGVIAYRMFTGQLPVGRFQDPNNYAPDMPLALNNLIILALSQQPSQRPNNAAKFLSLLNQALKKDTQNIQVHDQEVMHEVEEGTAIWAEQNTIQIKTELTPLENKITELLKQQGEIKAEDLLFLQPLADIAHINESALQEFIALIIQQKINQQQIIAQKNIQQTNNHNHSADGSSNNNLVELILWVKTVNKHFNQHQQLLSDALVNSLISAGLATTDKSAVQLKALIDAKQQRATPVNKIQTVTLSLFNKVKKRPLTILSVIAVVGLTLIYGNYQAQKTLNLADVKAWQQAKKTHSEDSYQLYLVSMPEGDYGNQAKQALAKLLKINVNAKRHQAAIKHQLIIAVQQELIKQGNQISQTGKLDQRTSDAIKTFEKSHQLLITGKADEFLLKKMRQVYLQKDNELWLFAQDKHRY